MAEHSAGATRSAPGLARLRLSYSARINLVGVLFLLPVLGFFIVFKFYPMSQAFWLSLTHYDISGPAQFVGLDNYADLLGDDQFLQAVWNSLYYIVGTVVPIWIGALILALLFNQTVWGKDFLRLAFFVPVITPAIVVAVIWKFLYHPYGLVNGLLSVLGFGRIDWLTTQTLVMPALILVAIWRTIPYFMIIVLAGLQAIPRDFYEAASLDGANRWQSFRYVTIPLLRPTLVLMVVISVLMAIKVFINPLIMTGGGPSGASRVLPLLIYQMGFQYFRLGLASAMSVFLFVGVMVFTLVQFRIFRHSTEY